MEIRTRDAVQWLIEYPTPLFLCTVNERSMTVRIYHVFSRFYVWAFSNTLPDSLELTPGEGQTGECVQWVDGSSFSLSAPIIEASMRDLMDDDQFEALRAVFAHWVQYDRENCDLVRQGLPIFRMPASYTVKTTVKLRAVAEQGNTAPPPMLLQRGMLRLAEALQCVGGLHGNRGDGHSPSKRLYCLTGSKLNIRRCSKILSFGVIAYQAGLVRLCCGDV